LFAVSSASAVSFFDFAEVCLPANPALDDD
jgi:hypothetical protein